MVHGRNMYCGQRECYDLLGVERTASATDIRKQYRALSLLVHPDKNPSADAAAAFQALATAYEVLTDASKRAAYDHYLDHPQDYAYNYGMYVQYAYAPQSDARVIVLAFVLFLSLCQYFAQVHRHKQAIAYFRQSDTVKRQAMALQAERNAGLKRAKDKKAKDAAKAELEAITDELMASTEISGGYEKPALRKLLLIRLVLLPYSLTLYVVWRVRWWYHYAYLRRPYAPEAALYLTCKALDITEDYFHSEQFPHNRDDVLARQLWEPNHLATFQKELEDDWKRRHPTKYKQLLRQRKKAGDESS
ncbi:hypothetical protein SPRG_17391 [Saprolegnia parasitica CBS 223.65]|uniref:J domain-containing protein n=1 Tax=Saprolegnia parasitica (strain CBS 223.65) TaxID=695850 RepID=A0A067BES8_SAPPC|nr:hypothetical protein SPRG_17391 [Saprolegnia parasitica CBS 223.65]KDO16889.1 hypothetical protein SPRG_17391 [Saprolegnia parasitica CBS 223.65]|eukprot:XP_012212402.1 hypothetical protein SPRG_17391 [Saprolegnia parasitica CBS 223.65]